jgi:TolB-like protein
MVSLISGYEYDIFISYRQKDNKHDGWVTDFVNNLKGELETAFKEEISVYFDINPHDGLLETHDVDASLKDKLKCLVFIPVISRTYCDPKSFAWEHEFKAFVEQASRDQFGLKVKLPNGNVASRALPVRIHDLDSDDTNSCESLLGGALRGVEFIYREPGVSRPLTPDDDVKTNLNKTKYRNQINKVALAIKEVITTVSKHGQQSELISERATEQILLSASIEEEFEKSIAVLPFINDSPDQENTYFINGVMEEILSSLQRIKDFRVISRTSVEQYRGQGKPIAEIAEELGVNYIVEGSGQKYGKAFRLRAQLIKADRETHLWGKSYQKKINDIEDIFNIQIQIAESIASELKAVVTPEEKKLIEKIPTADLAAYDAFLKGKFYAYKTSSDDMDTAMRHFELAKERDPAFALPYAGIGLVWMIRQQLGMISPEEAGPKIMEAVGKALELDSTLAEVQFTLATMNVLGMWDWEGGESAFKKAIEINPNHAEAHALYSQLLIMLGRPEEAMEHVELALKLDPHNPIIKVWYSADLLLVHRYDDCISVSRAVFEKNPTLFLVLGNLFLAYHMKERYDEAFKAAKLCFYNVYQEFDHVFDQYEKLGYSGTLNLEGDTLLAQSKSKYIAPADIAIMYILAGNKERALDCLEQAYEMHDPNVVYTGIYPQFSIIHHEPRYQELLRKLNLTYK